MARVPPHLTAFAREMRNAPTPAERAVWIRVSQFRPRFTRQLRIGPYIVDLACRRAKLGVEFDGSQHVGAAAHDARRSAFLESLGWQIIRLWNSDVLANPDGAAQHILDAVAKRMATHPQPLPSREGRERRPRVRTQLPSLDREGPGVGGPAVSPDRP